MTLLSLALSHSLTYILSGPFWKYLSKKPHNDTIPHIYPNRTLGPHRLRIIAWIAYLP